MQEHVISASAALLNVMLLLLILPTGIDAAVGFSPIVECTDVPARTVKGVILDASVTVEVCYTYSFETPSPGVILLENGKEVTEYTGFNGYLYEFWQGLEEGTDTEQIESSSLEEYVAEPGSVSIRWENDASECELVVGGVDCTSCTVCPADVVQVSADCTNVPLGRKVVCEDPTMVLYPLVSFGSIEEMPPEGATENNETTATAESNGTTSHAFACDALPRTLMLITIFSSALLVVFM